MSSKKAFHGKANVVFTYTSLQYVHLCMDIYGDFIHDLSCPALVYGESELRQVYNTNLFMMLTPHHLHSGLREKAVPQRSPLWR